MTFTPRDAKDVSALVAKKLELYMNVERREDRFDPQGYLRTTPKMKTLDLMYQMLDKAELDGKTKSSPRCRQSQSPGHKASDHRGKKASREKKKGPHDQHCDEDANVRHCNENERITEGAKSRKKDKQKIIRPKLINNSRRVVPRNEADRITRTVNKIFEEQDLDRLHVIHRYRPHSPDVASLTENGKVLGYTRHVGSALHGDHYVDFYLREGLQTGKADHSKRLQRLKEDKEKNDNRPSGKDSSSAKDQQLRQPRHDWATKSRMRDILSPLAPSSSCESVSSAGASGRRTSSSQRPVYTTFLSSTPMSSRASAGQALESHLGYKVLSRIEDGKRLGAVDGGRGEGDLSVGEKWEVGCCDEAGGARQCDDDNDIMGAGSVSARQESRADLASSEDYCKFSTGKNTSLGSESRHDEESGISKDPSGNEEDDDAASKTANDPIQLRDVQMNYKRYRSPDTGFVLSGLGAAEISPRGLGSLISARSTQSEPVKGSRHRSVRSRNRLPVEISPFPTTVSEDGSSTTRTITSSVESSTPRKALSYREPAFAERYKDKADSQTLEPIRAILETPEVPRLGLTSDLNDTNRSLFSNERVEDYTTAEQQVRQHPDTRASEGHVSSRAGEGDDRNKDGRAEDKDFPGMDPKTEVTVQREKTESEGSGQPDTKSVTENHLALEEDRIKKDDQRIMEAKTDHSSSSVGKLREIETDRQSETNHNIRQSNISNASQKSSSEHGAIINSQSRPSSEKGRGLEIERGEDEGRNTEFDRGHETGAASSGISHREKKKLLERGDDMSETFHEDIRLSQSARKRGQSQYHTTNKSERGLEREYFTPLANQAEQYIIPVDAQIEDSLLEASELNSRPSSASSSKASQASDAGSKRKKKSLRRFSKTSNASVPKKEAEARPTSAASKDGRGDDSLSIASASTTSQKNQATDKNDERERPASAKSYMSQKSSAAQCSVSSRGSVSGKDKPGNSQGYYMANVESVGRGLDDMSPCLASEKLVEDKNSMAVLNEGDNLPKYVNGFESKGFESIKTDMKNEEEQDRAEADLSCRRDSEADINIERRDREINNSTEMKYNQVQLREEQQIIHEVLPLLETKENQESGQVTLRCEQNLRENVEDVQLSHKEKGIKEDQPLYLISSLEGQPKSNDQDRVSPEQKVPTENSANAKLEKNRSPDDEVSTGSKAELSEPNQIESRGGKAEDGQRAAQPETPNKEGSPSMDVPLQEKAFIESGDTTEIVKAPVSACVSLEADTTVIDFRPSSASTAKSFTVVDHEAGTHESSVKEKQKIKPIQPSRIVEVTESEGSPTPGRDTHRAIYTNNEIIQRGYIFPQDSKDIKQLDDGGQVMDLAQINMESQVSEKSVSTHPGIKKQMFKSDLKSKTQEQGDCLEEKSKCVDSKMSSDMVNRDDLSQKSGNEVKSDDRSPSANSQKSGDKVLDNRPSSAASQKSVTDVQSGKRSQSATSQRSSEKIVLDNTPPPVACQESISKAKEVDRPSSAASQKSHEEKVLDNRPPSVVSQESSKKAKVVDRPSSSTSQKSNDKADIVDRPPSAISQKPNEKIVLDNTPPPVACQESNAKAKDVDRPPSATNQKPSEKIVLDNRPPSVDSQESSKKAKVVDRPPSAASQKSNEKIVLDNRPPSVASQVSSNKAKVDERPSSVASQNCNEKIALENKPPSSACQESSNKAEIVDRPSSAASQKSNEKIVFDNVPTPVACQESSGKVKEVDKPPSATSQKSSEKIALDNRPPSVASQESSKKAKVVDRPPSAASQKSNYKIVLDNRPPSVASQESSKKAKKSNEKVLLDNRPPSAASQKSSAKVVIDKRPPSVASVESSDKAKVVDRPPSAASQKSNEKTVPDNRPPSAASQKSNEKIVIDKGPPSVASQESSSKAKVIDRPASAASQKSNEKIVIDNRLPSVASQESSSKAKVIDRPPSAASQMSNEKIVLDNRPPSAAIEESSNKAKIVDGPPSAVSQKSNDKIVLDNTPPPVACQESSSKAKEVDRPPSAASQKSSEKIVLDNRPPSVASQELSKKAKVVDRPPSAASQKSNDKIVLDNRPPSVTSQESSNKAKVVDRPPSAASQKSNDKIVLDNRPPSVASQDLSNNAKVVDKPPSTAGEKSI
ncbi:sericin 2 [Plakobranchus ocellatus]|uniref:Sericin 2 n=1 Tax=Plakobranchus ocellatus TaxID=259542 RepID=A0AAV4DW02_9GAST|nr:sericin 2 [Plakobranchus ocellatus]